MYTLLVNDNNEIITTVKERIMQRSKLVDKLHFLVNPTYKGLDMSDWAVMMEYITPVGREYKTETLVKSDELYKEKLEYQLPFDTCLTKEAGKIELQLTFIKLEMDADGNVVQRVRKAGPATITIVPVSAWSNIIPDSALSALDQRLIMTEAMINAANKTIAMIDSTQADNMVYDQETNILQLTANGQLIGDAVKIGGTSSGIDSIEIDKDGNMIVHYSDGRSENIGQAIGSSCTGVYVPSYSRDGILTFTLKEDAEEPIYEFDINPLNDWNPIDSVEENSDYIWEEL
jgi:flagellar hook protein FlgE